MAASYILLRALDRQLDISRQTARNYANTQRIFDLRHKGGVVSKLELAQVQSQYQQALAAIPALEQQIEAQENLIALLQGRNPYPIPRGKAIDELAAPGIPGGLPSALLERRPDILQAEQNLVAANANIGAAKALYFPQINLTGSLGSASADFSNFLSGPALAWSLAAGIAGPLFTAGGIAGQVSTAEAEQRRGARVLPADRAERLPRDQRRADRHRQEAAGVQRRRRCASRRCASTRGCRACASTTATPAISKCCMRRTSCSPPSWRPSGPTPTRYVQIVNVYKAMGGGWVDLADRGTAAGRDAPVPERAAKQPLF